MTKNEITAMNATMIIPTGTFISEDDSRNQENPRKRLTSHFAGVEFRTRQNNLKLFNYELFLKSLVFACVLQNNEENAMKKFKKENRRKSIGSYLDTQR